MRNGSAWSTERKDIRRYKGTCDIFFGIEHRLRKEEMEGQFNKEAKEGWRFAADAARITDGRAGSEDQKHTSGGIFVAVDSNLGAVIGEREGAVVSILGNEGSMVRRIVPERKRKICRSLRSWSLKATRRLMSWQCRMKGLWQKQKSRNYAAGKRRGVCSTAVCGQLPLPGRTMERL